MVRLTLSLSSVIFTLKSSASPRVWKLKCYFQYFKILYKIEPEKLLNHIVGLVKPVKFLFVLNATKSIFAVSNANTFEYK